MSNYRSIGPQSLAEAFKALSNPNRLKIYLQLMSCCQPGTVCRVDEVEKSCVGDLGAALDVAPSTLSHHIKELNRAGLIQMQRRGKHVDCWVDPDRVQQLAQFFNPIDYPQRHTPVTQGAQNDRKQTR